MHNVIVRPRFARGEAARYRTALSVLRVPFWLALPLMLGSLACGAESSAPQGSAGGTAGQASGGEAAGGSTTGGLGGKNPGGNSSGGAAAGGVGGDAGVGGAAGAGGAAAAGGAGGGFGGMGGGAGECANASPFAVRAVDHLFGSGQTFGQQDFPQNVLGPPRGGGCCGGSLDVVSLGIGGWVVLELGDTVVDGPGADLLVFENAFEYGTGQIFAEPGSVAVSADGVTWWEFPCSASEAPWGHCAGTHPVYANVDENDVDPTDPATAGGDAYDLADVGLAEARYVRITDRADLVGSVFDLDAVAVVNGRCSQ